MRVDQFDFDLPQELIALRPAVPRDTSKLLLVRPNLPPDDCLQDRVVHELPEFLRAGDALVFNNTKVIPAQLDGIRIRDGSSAHFRATLHMRVAPDRWKAFVRGAKKLKIEDRVRFGHSITTCLLGALDATVVEKGDAGEVEFAFDLADSALDDALVACGQVPLPPYIEAQRPIDDRDDTDYQTIYADERGAVAAPTAGLHFTDELFTKLDQKGISRHFLTLHVGAGTFLPVKAEDTSEHKMHSEIGRLDADLASRLNEIRKNGGRLISVGTTSLRLLESASDQNGTLYPFDGPTDIFITPGYQFKVVDGLMTNFHLPRSTLFMLVCAFAGFERMKSAYKHAIDNQYRFYSYGDSSLLFRETL